jgi:hypothetical protein
MTGFEKFEKTGLVLLTADRLSAGVCDTATQEITLTNSMWIFRIKEQFG